MRTSKILVTNEDYLTQHNIIKVELLSNEYKAINPHTYVLLNLFQDLLCNGSLITKSLPTIYPHYLRWLPFDWLIIASLLIDLLVLTGFSPCLRFKFLR